MENIHGEDKYILGNQNDHVQEDGMNQQDEEYFTVVELLNIKNIFNILQT